ncbi:MAG TPA: hypothetical protein VGN77_08315 [Steroidobacteraceae bacterium]|nr:hypothetical protein [Steroidobacteraceae bacterium]
MQQATSSIDRLVSTAGTSLSPRAVSPPRFVVNLCASTTPVGLVQPTHTGLKRFTFFVSRRLEEGRERFRLHMGYFDSQEEAEKILDLVRDVYPAAWAGAAPGIKLRARAALPEPAPLDVPAAASVVAPAVVPVAALAVPVRIESAVAAVSLTAPVQAPPAPVAQATPVAPTSVPSVAPLTLELAPDLPRAKPAMEIQSNAAGHDATGSLSDVRATIASLGDTAEVAAPPAEAVLESAAVLRLLTSARPAPAARLAPVQSAAKRNAARAPVEKSAAAKPVAKAAPAGSVQPEQAVFAVQLLWSVQPIDMSQVPQLAIFSAYTLYGAEGNRDGRRWYGLRLGFFTDAVSAKQVAQYVRSEFTSVSVVPVAERERTRASAATAKPLPALELPKSNDPELNFINELSTDTGTTASRPALEAAAALASKETPTLRPAVVSALGMSSRATPGKRAKLRPPAATKTTAKRLVPNRALSLEETLEILGAGQLQIESGRRDLLSESAVRDRKGAAPSVSRFGRLINRLAERLGNG